MGIVRSILFYHGATEPSAQWAKVFSLARIHVHTQTHAHSLGHLWRSDQLVAETSTWQHTKQGREKHPRTQRDSNPPIPNKRVAADPCFRQRVHWDQQRGFLCLWMSYQAWYTRKQDIFSVFSHSHRYNRRMKTSSSLMNLLAFTQFLTSRE